jgi:hypothetical protein
MDRLNVKLEMKGVEPMQDLVKDFSDGVKLIQLLVSCSHSRMDQLTLQEIMSESSLGRYNLRPTMRVQKAEVRSASLYKR